MCCTELETFAADYRKFVHKRADDLADILEVEMFGIFGTGHDVEGWDEFRSVLRSRMPFAEKYDRYRKLIDSIQPKSVAA